MALLLLLGQSLMAQPVEPKNETWKIGISYFSFGPNDVISLNSKDLVGAASYRGDHFFGMGLNAVKPLNQWLEFETGLEIARHKIVIHPAPNPGYDAPYGADFNVVDIPLTLRANFWRYFFLHGGLLLDIDPNAGSPIDSQSGIGIILGPGINYEFGFGGSVFVNYYSKIHSLIPFADWKYHLSAAETGLRIGVMYRFGRAGKQVPAG